MKIYICALVVISAFQAGSAGAVNKCTGPDGRVSFQDAPCISGRAETLDVKPSAGPAAKPAAPSNISPTAAPVSEAERLEGIVAASQRSRRAHDLRERVLPDAERTLKEHRVGCDEKQKSLAAQQYAYQQNLYGKTHAAQIASEMAAAAAICGTKDRELKDLVDALIKECATLRCRG